MKHFIKVIAFGIVLGVVLAFLQNALRIEKNTFLLWYFIVGIAVIVGVALVNLLYNRHYWKEMLKAAALLGEGKTEEYVDAVDRLLQRAKGRRLKNLLKLNLSAGYCDLKQYDRAIQILEDLSQEKLSGVVKMVRRLNLCVCYFYSGQNDKAMELYQASEQEFAPFRKDANYGGSLAILEILAALEKGEKDRAGALLKQAKETWNYPRLQDDYRRIEERLGEIKTE